jgi:predicted DNA-binding mobile mystery protein A
METKKAQARRNLDRRFDRIRPLLKERPPHRGWIRAIRDALGMTGPELAARMGVGQSTLTDIESSEQLGTIKIDTLRRAAAALECDFVYFLVPRIALNEMVSERAHRNASIHFGGVVHNARLEDQELDPVVAREELEAFASGLVDRRGLWVERAEK